MTSRKISRVGKYHYLYERESYWDPDTKRSRQRITRYFGRCDSKGNLLTPAKPRVEAIHAAFPVGPLSVFYATAQELDLTKHIRRVLDVDTAAASNVLTLALNQLVGHRPLDKLDRWVQRTPLPHWENLDPTVLTRETYESALHALCHVTREGVVEDRGLALQQALTQAWRGKTREPAQYYYDVTKQLYYGDHCNLAEPGYYPGGTRKHVIGFGLVTSRHRHLPVLCRAIPGSRHDTVTVQDTVHTLQAFGFDHLTLIMDRGMVSEENVEFVVKSGYEQVGLVPETHKRAWAYVAKWPSEQVEQPRFIVQRGSGSVVYARSWTASLLGRKRMKVAVVVNPFRKVHEQVGRDHLLWTSDQAKDKKALRNVRQELGDLAKPAPGRRGFAVDQDAVVEDQKGDGRFLMFSTDTSLDAEDMVRVYSERESIEKAFRTVKGELSLGPIRYRRSDRINAYTTVVYLAYLLWSMTELRLREKFPALSLEQALEALEGMAWVRFGQGKQVHEWATRPSGEQEKILKTLGATRFLPVG